MTMRQKAMGFAKNPEAQFKFHLVHFIIWILLVVPTVTVWGDNLRWTNFMSVWALVIGCLTSMTACLAAIEAKS